MKKQISALALAATLFVAGAGLSACGNKDADGSPAASVGTTGTSTSGSEASAHGAIMVSDPWVKATDSEMSAMFGEVMNHSDHDRTIVKATSDVAGMVQLHTTITTANGGSEMKEKEGGFPLAKGATLTFAPGGDHVMLMGLKKKLEAGDTVKVTLTFDDGSTVDVEAPVKAFAGAQESYAPEHGESSSDH